MTMAMWHSLQMHARRSTQSLLLFAGVALLTGSMQVTNAGAAAAEQNYPTRALRIVVPFAPGGGTDILARLLGARLAEAWSQPIVVDNRPGGATVIGMELVAKAPADGYTLLISTGNFTVNPALFPKLPFDTGRDFMPVSMLATAPNVLVVHPSLPVKNVRELIAFARPRPRQINYGSSGNGGTGHLAMEMLKQMAGVDLVHIPYKGGGPALNAVLMGEVSVLFNNMIATVPHINSGRLRALGVTTKARSSIVPEIPSIAESGLPGFEATGWFGAFVPAGTADAVVQKLASEIGRIVNLKDVRELLLGQGAVPIGNSSREFGEFIRVDIERWKLTLASIRIVAD
jgi:tripartite-type tricarboxylate transporter receptor subunit TctC